MTPDKQAEELMRLADDYACVAYAARSAAAAKQSNARAALLAAIRDALGGWRPISEAPERGRVLLLVPTRWGKHAPAIVAEGSRDFGDFWVIFNADEAVQLVEPTHFRPLPAPPATEKET